MVQMLFLTRILFILCPTTLYIYYMLAVVTAAIYIELLLKYINIKSVKLDLLKDLVLSVYSLQRIVL